jgi:hypothetical protein
MNERSAVIRMNCIDHVDSMRMHRERIVEVCLAGNSTT